MQPDTYAYAGEIAKSERTPDGDLLVWGKATGPDLDLDEQICDATWLKQAMPGWAEWGNVREQHSTTAAGHAVETVQDGDDWYVKALVTDKNTAHKVEAGTLKGYSVGIRDARVVKDAAARGGRIVAGKIVEISLVDRPCNPTAKVAIAKTIGWMDETGDLDAVDDEAKSKPKAAKTRAANLLSVRAYKAALAAVEAVKAGPTLQKMVDESEDIAGAWAAIGQICDLIIHEATELKTGRMEEKYDIECLTEALCALQHFIENEAYEHGGADGPYQEDIDMAVVPEINKTSGGETAGTTEQVDITEIVNKAVAEATSASEERLKALEAELAKVKATPIPGGPVLVRTAPTPQQTTTGKAARYEEMASQSSDPGVAAAYRAAAAALPKE